MVDPTIQKVFYQRAASEMQTKSMHSLPDLLPRRCTLVLE